MIFRDTCNIAIFSNISCFHMFVPVLSVISKNVWFIRINLEFQNLLDSKIQFQIQLFTSKHDEKKSFKLIFFSSIKYFNKQNIIWTRHINTSLLELKIVKRFTVLVSLCKGFALYHSWYYFSFVFLRMGFLSIAIVFG